MSAQEVFKEILPILQKAAPIICESLTTPIAKIACALLAVTVNANANDHKEIADKLSNDPDLYKKLSNLENTHADFVRSLR